MNTFETIFYLIGQAQSTPPPPGGAFGSFIPFILIFVIFYFLLIRPQKQKQKKLQQQVDAMRTGDKVITAGGIHGLVTNVKKESVTVKVDNSTRIEFEKGSIATVIGKKGANNSQPETTPEPEETVESQPQKNESNDSESGDRDNFQRDR
ncbi:MAG: preprotein translocase subunit YajC [Verrucomicrobiales bacterium]|nr:preprotein translocase subunit YajC [Verrucomicrobiales bacterium]|tara:strand:- start:353 stop:802 length:450 start_codon:yes stop_codon:yes gene_type:complete